MQKLAIILLLIWSQVSLAQSKKIQPKNKIKIDSTFVNHDTIQKTKEVSSYHKGQLVKYEIIKLDENNRVVLTNIYGKDFFFNKRSYYKDRSILTEVKGQIYNLQEFLKDSLTYETKAILSKNFDPFKVDKYDVNFWETYRYHNLNLTTSDGLLKKGSKIYQADENIVKAIENAKLYLSNYFSESIIKKHLVVNYFKTRINREYYFNYLLLSDDKKNKEENTYHISFSLKFDKFTYYNIMTITLDDNGKINQEESYNLPIKKYNTLLTQDKIQKLIQPKEEGLIKLISLNKGNYKGLYYAFLQPPFIITYPPSEDILYHIDLYDVNSGQYISSFVESGFTLGLHQKEIDIEIPEELSVKKRGDFYGLVSEDYEEEHIIIPFQYKILRKESEYYIGKTKENTSELITKYNKVLLKGFDDLLFIYSADKKFKYCFLVGKKGDDTQIITKEGKVLLSSSEEKIIYSASIEKNRIIKINYKNGDKAELNLEDLLFNQL
ncbi:hypothetical protein [Flammeovirga kamogawensis]|uniref:WG repeat-containing protein n=1 Tax=Flammeovirga kamogawensis TaxID=373891 RepID=A0ABX8H4V6_9BACT|nr:hypothetical protein [Flammeovirga kamogawensis]QWG10788.1 hypothetical protein KM029_26645 [Flammeovirga kamogawensis]TRX63225.1 hypothetical protein EO216_26585 [Flammeovirga kamogawensis]